MVSDFAWSMRLCLPSYRLRSECQRAGFSISTCIGDLREKLCVVRVRHLSCWGLNGKAFSLVPMLQAQFFATKHQKTHWSTLHCCRRQSSISSNWKRGSLLQFSRRPGRVWTEPSAEVVPGNLKKNYFQPHRYAKCPKEKPEKRREIRPLLDFYNTIKRSMSGPLQVQDLASVSHVASFHIFLGKTTLFCHTLSLKFLELTFLSVLLCSHGCQLRCVSIASFRLLLKSDRGRLSLEGSSGSYQQVLVLAMQILSAEDSRCAHGDFGRWASWPSDKARLFEEHLPMLQSIRGIIITLLLWCISFGTGCFKVVLAKSVKKHKI